MSLFITQCPHCHTTFKTSISQLQSADGMVRCGACLRVFTADDNLLPSADLRTITRPFPATETATEAETEANEEESSAEDVELEPLTLSALDTADAEVAHRQDGEMSIFTLALTDSLPNRISPSIAQSSTFWEIIDAETLEPLEDQATASELELELEPESESDPESATATDMAATAAIAYLKDATETLDRDAPYLLEEEIPDAAQIASAAVAAVVNTEEAQSPPPTVDETETAADAETGVAADDSSVRARIHASRFDEDILLDEGIRPDTRSAALPPLSEEEFAHINDTDAPLELRWQEPVGRGRGQWLFPTLAGVLVLSLGLQVLWFNRDTLSQSPTWRPLLERVCAVTGCALAPITDIQAIHSDALQVRSHPDIANALSVHIVLRNDAAFAQPFPGLYLRFSDTQGETVVQRRFTPAEYLPEGVSALGMLPPMAPLQITLDILDPGPKAINYELGFYAIEP